jgi:hypothetical protein
LRRETMQIPSAPVCSREARNGGTGEMRCRGFWSFEPAVAEIPQAAPVGDVVVDGGGPPSRAAPSTGSPSSSASWTPRRNSLACRTVDRQVHQHRAVDAGGIRRLADVERDLIRPRTAEGRSRAKAQGHGPETETDRGAAGRGPPPTRARRDACRTRVQLRCGQEHDSAVRTLTAPTERAIIRYING